MCYCKPKCYKKENLWETLLKKHEEKVKFLMQKRCEIQHRLEVLQCVLPALMCYRAMQKKPATSQLYKPALCSACQCDAEVNIPSALSFECSCSQSISNYSIDELLCMDFIFSGAQRSDTQAQKNLRDTRNGRRYADKKEAFRGDYIDKSMKTEEVTCERDRPCTKTKDDQEKIPGVPFEGDRTYQNIRDGQEVPNVADKSIKGDQETLNKASDVVSEGGRTDKSIKDDQKKESKSPDGEGIQPSIEEASSETGIPSEEDRTIKIILSDLINSFLSSTEGLKDDADSKNPIKSLLLELINRATDKLISTRDFIENKSLQDVQFVVPNANVKPECTGEVEVIFPEKDTKSNISETKTDASKSIGKSDEITLLESDAKSDFSEVKTEASKPIEKPDEVPFLDEISEAKTSATKSTGTPLEVTKSDSSDKKADVDMKSTEITSVKFDVPFAKCLGAGTKIKAGSTGTECKSATCQAAFAIGKEIKPRQIKNKRILINSVPSQVLCTCCICDYDSSIKVDSVYSSESSCISLCADDIYQQEDMATSITSTDINCICKNSWEEIDNFYEDCCCFETMENAASFSEMSESDSASCVSSIRNSPSVTPKSSTICFCKRT